MAEKKRSIQLIIPESFYQEVKAEAERRSNTVPGFIRYMMNVYMTALQRNRMENSEHHTQ